MLYYFEGINRKTNEQFSAIAKTFHEACEKNGYKTKECKCISKAIF